VSVRRDLMTSLRLFLVLAVLCGGVYSVVVLGIAQGLFPRQANGSLVVVGGQVVGSALIGQDFSGPDWFQGRPSATMSDDGSRAQPYNAANSSASNLGPTNPDLGKQVQAAAQKLEIPLAQVPPDLVESSGSGLDPDITPAAALVQVPAVAAARHVDPAALRALVARLTRGPFLGMFGGPHVNVLELNLALKSGRL